MMLSGKGLACQRGGRMVFSGLDFSLRAGQALPLTGPNGAGKSSLLRLLAGLLPAAAGRIDFKGGSPERSLGEQAHYLGHQDALKTQLTVLENISFWASYMRGTLAGDDALTAVGLCELANVPAAYLSAGQRRRLSLARLVAIQRPVWLLDEPNASLDDSAQKILSAMMRDHLKRGGLIIAATHAPLGIKSARELRLGRAR